MEVCNFREAGRLDQKLLLGNEVGDEVDFRFIEVELILVELPIHIRVREENLCCASLDDHVHDVRLPQLIERLCG